MRDIRVESWAVTKDFFEDLSAGLARINTELWWRTETHRTDFVYLFMACSWMRAFDQVADDDLIVEFDFRIDGSCVSFDVTPYVGETSGTDFPDFATVVAPMPIGDPGFDDWVEARVQDAIAYVRENYDKIAALLT